jgi:hypothetical protein
MDCEIKDEKKCRRSFNGKFGGRKNNIQSYEEIFKF